MANAESKSRHKGIFIGGYFTEEQIAKIKLVEQKYNDDYGKAEGNRTRALRWILDAFDPSCLVNFPKNQPFASTSAQTPRNN